MSIALMTLAWKIDASSTDKLVLLALADWANADGICWPSMRQLADKSGLAERGLQMAIKRLCSEGHLTRREVTGKGVNYTVHPRTTCAPAKSAPPHESTRTPARRAPNTSVTVMPTEATLPTATRARKSLVGFAEFWALYPRKTAKAAAEKAWPKACQRCPPAEIIEATRRYADNPPDPEFTPHPATWLNQARFEDETDARRTRPMGGNGQAGQPRPSGTPRQQAIAEIRADLERWRAGQAH